MPSQRTRAQRNNGSGVLNVSPHRGKWVVRIVRNGKEYYGGYYTDLNAADDAAKALRKKVYGS